MLNKISCSLKRNTLVGKVGRADKLCNTDILSWHLGRISCFRAFTTLLQERKVVGIVFNTMISISYLAMADTISFIVNFALVFF